MCRAEPETNRQRCCGIYAVRDISDPVKGYSGSPDGIWTPANPNVRGEYVPARAILLPVLGGRTNQEWISQYSSSHQHPLNRLCHTLGIPMILLSGVLFLGSIFVHFLWIYALALFLIGWAFQFIGHAFEGKPPEFFHDWRFLFVGVRWWWAKIHGKA